MSEPFSYCRKVHYYETDQMGIVHHSNYIRWFEEARVAFFDHLGLSYHAMEQSGIQSPVLEIACQYRGMLRFDDAFAVRVSILEYTGTRLALSYQVTGPDGRLCTTGESRHCFLGSSGRPVSLKKAAPQWHSLFLQRLEEQAAPEKE